MKQRKTMNKKRKTDSGFALLGYITVIAMLLLATVLSYHQVSIDEGYQSNYKLAEQQAYLLSQRGIVEQGFKYLRSRRPTDLTMATIIFPDRTIDGKQKYANTTIERKTSNREGDVFGRSDAFVISSTGVSKFYGSFGVQRSVSRTTDLTVRLRAFSNYLYLTDIETTEFDEIIWFWGPGEDTLRGRVHSNDYIGIRGRPAFYGKVTTSKSEFIHGIGYDPYFSTPPSFNVPKVFFPVTAENIRNNASIRFTNDHGRLITCLQIDEGEIQVAQYQLGLPHTPENVENESTVGVPNNGCIFVEGQLELSGILTGKLSIASSENMWLVDNIRYSETNPYTGFPVDGQQLSSILGLVSERNIIIKNTWENGRENSSRGSSIIINAAVVALNESFTFQHQNDEFDAYLSPVRPDERGAIFLLGCVSQHRRGYVHRSNFDGTGYDKQYLYDNRLDSEPPPYFLETTDESGAGFFDICRWTELDP